MTINGKIHCLFEQSGTFKDEFAKLGYTAYDYDIQNNFGKTDFIIDLFSEIKKGYDGKPSVFDTITPDDLIMAFFPCIYFCEINQRFFSGDSVTYRIMSKMEIIAAIIEREREKKILYFIVKVIRNCRAKGVAPDCGKSVSCKPLFA